MQCWTVKSDTGGVPAAHFEYNIPELARIPAM